MARLVCAGFPSYPFAFDTVPMMLFWPPSPLSHCGDYGGFPAPQLPPWIGCCRWPARGVPCLVPVPGTESGWRRPSGTFIGASLWLAECLTGRPGRNGSDTIRCATILLWELGEGNSAAEILARGSLGDLRTRASCCEQLVDSGGNCSTGLPCFCAAKSVFRARRERPGFLRRSADRRIHKPTLWRNKASGSAPLVGGIRGLPWRRGAS